MHKLAKVFLLKILQPDCTEIMSGQVIWCLFPYLYHKRDEIMLIGHESIDLCIPITIVLPHIFNVYQEFIDKPMIYEDPLNKTSLPRPSGCWVWSFVLSNHLW